MRLAVIFPTTIDRGGTQTMTKTLVEGCQRAGVEVRVFGIGTSTVDQSWRQALPFTELPPSKANKVVQLFHYAVALARALRTYKPDAVIALYPSSIAVACLANLLMAKRIPIASWIHSPERWGIYGKAIPYADCHLAISSGLARKLKERTGGKKNNIHLVYNSIDLPQPLLPRDTTRPRPRFLYVGRVQEMEQKRVRDLILAAGRLHGDFELLIVGGVVGNGPDIENLRRLASELRIAEKIHWAGWLAAPWAAVDSADVLVMTSAYEGFGMVLIEAMCRGIPCISSDCESGPDEVIVPGENGWLYPVGDVDALRSLMQKVVDDRSILPPVEKVAASVQKFSIEAMIGRIVTALETVIRA